MALNAVMQLHQTVVEAFNGVQLQRHVTVTPRYQRNAIPNKHRGHTDDELVDHVLVKTGGDELAAAHQPDILARLLSKTAHEWAECPAHELHAGRGVGWWRVTGEDDVPILRVELCPHAEGRVVGFPAQQHRVDRPHERVHAVEAGGSRAGRQPFEITVRPCDVTVRAGSDMDDDLSPLRHEYRSPVANGSIIQ